MPLREWQQQFQSAVLGDQPFDAVPLRECGIDCDTGLGIYANAYRERLHEALRDNFSALHQLLGDRDFAEMAYAFTAAHPPQSASIRWFGALLPDYLYSVEPFRQFPAIGELARFEWALRHAVDAADGRRVTAGDLQTLGAEQWAAFRCAAHPSLTVLHFHWNTPQIWRALDAGQAPPDPSPLESHWMVYRGTGLTSEWRSASADEVEAIAQWARGESFGGLCECLAERLADADAAINTAAALMRAWVDQGLLIHTDN